MWRRVEGCGGCQRDRLIEEWGYAEKGRAGEMNACGLTMSQTGACILSRMCGASEEMEDTPLHQSREKSHGSFTVYSVRLML